MTKTHTWTLTGLATIALAAGILLATGAVGSAQEGTATPTPSATEEATDGTATPTPSATDDATEDTATPTPVPGESDADSDESNDNGSDDSSRSGHLCRGAHPLIFDNAAEILGITQDELRAAKQSGQSLADIAVAQGMTADDFTAQLDSAVRADIQAQLSAGEITQEEFDDISADLTDKLAEIINSTGGARFGGRGALDSDGTDGARFRTPFESSDAGTDV